MLTRRNMITRLFSSIAAMFAAPLMFSHKTTSTYKGMTREEFHKAANSILESEKLTSEEAALKKYYDETEINSKPVWLGSNDKFYDLFVDNKGNLIDGTEIRPFLDWTPAHPEQPRWARIIRDRTEGVDIVGGTVYTKDKIITYLDSEIHTVDHSISSEMRTWFGEGNLDEA